MPRSGKLAELARRDLAAGGSGWSDEYLALHRRVRIVGGVMSLLVLITIVLMATQP